MFEGIFGKKEYKEVVKLKPNQISPNPNQPRKEWDEKELHSLAESIKENGILQPLSVRRLENNSYELISGERRLRAAGMVGLTEVPCIIIEANDIQSATFALIENMQRQDLDFFEEAAAISKLIEIYNISQQEIATKLAKSQSSIANKLRLLSLSEEEIELIRKNGLTERHARALLRLKDKRQRGTVLDTIIKKQLRVSQTDSLVDKLLGSDKKPKNNKKVFIIKDIRLFLNTVNKSVNTLRNAGIDIVCNETRNSKFCELNIIIPLERKQPKDNKLAEQKVFRDVG